MHKQGNYTCFSVRAKGAALLVVLERRQGFPADWANAACVLGSERKNEIDWGTRIRDAVLCAERRQLRWFRHLMRRPPGCPPWEVSWARLKSSMGEDPGTDPEPTGGIIHHIWPGSSSLAHQCSHRWFGLSLWWQLPTVTHRRVNSHVTRDIHSLDRFKTTPHVLNLAVNSLRSLEKS